LKRLQRDEGTLDLLAVFVRKWFPGRAIDVDAMAEAQYLEWDYWQKMSKTINGS